MDTTTPNISIGTGIAEVLDAAYRELEGNEAVGTDLDDLFWSSVNANAGSNTAHSLDSVFYGSLVEGDDWTPKQQDVLEPAPPRGDPVIPDSVTAAAASLDKDAVINQIAEYAVREVEKRLPQSRARADAEGDYLLFSDGENGVYVGRPEQYGVRYDDPKTHMKNLLTKFYRGNQQELEQVAQQIITNAINGTPVDIKRWLGR